MNQNQNDIHDEDIGSNDSTNRTFLDVLDARVSRRTVLAGSIATATATFLGSSGNALAGLGNGASDGHKKKRPLIGFTPVSVADARGPWPMIAPEYQFDVIIPWGEPIQPDGPAFSYPPSAADQAQQVGIGHDGMHFYPLGKSKFGRGEGSEHGMLAINMEFGGNSHILGKAAPESLEDVRVSQHAHGVAVVEIKKHKGKWKTVKSKRARRVHVNTPVTFSGPVAGHALLQTPAGNPTLGTVNNCASGPTPWGTYLTCEENFNGYFGATNIPGAWVRTPAQQRYGFSAAGFGYAWEKFDPRFDLSNNQYTNEEHRFGWVVEIDPMDARQVPVKRTALGRIKHEGATIAVGQGGRVVCYMGDDERFDYIYKFVSTDNWKSMRARGLSPLDHGTLYVARFNDDGRGEWLPLSIDNPVLAARFADQAEILTFARLAADAVGATKMDRPEWITVMPNGDVYCTLTNNSNRGRTGFPGIDAANPIASNSYGHIIRWHDSDNHTGTSFTWDIFLMAQDKLGTEAAFGSPDGLWADPDGRLFIQTDGTQPDGMNDQMLVADPATGELRRLLSGVTGSEVTGITLTPDRRTAFVNLQHPGDGNPTLTNFPAATDGVTIPRDATLVITRKDGGIIGS